VSPFAVGVALPPAPVKTDAQITSALVELIELKDRNRVDLSHSEGTSLGEMLTIGSPIGYNLRNRFLNIGIPIAEALSRNLDPVFREKLVELARWDRDGETRAAALIAVARAQKLADLAIFQEALVHLNPAVRFGALESLQIWGHPEKSLALLVAAAEKDYEPILRVYAAAGIARLGETSGLERLRGFLDNPSWLVRAMAGRYLGDLGTAQDYDALVGRIGREQGNDFVLAEYCIAALKLFAKKSS
jgi:HEAT repeat protein